MPQLGPIDATLLDVQSNLVVGAAVNIYREGAVVNGNVAGTAPLTITIRHPGKISTGDTVFIDNDNSTLYSVTAQTLTTLQLSGFAGTLSLTNGQRIVPSNNQPTIYSDDQGGASVAQPLTSDAFGGIATSGGVAPLWMEGGAYHTLAAAVGGTARLYQMTIIAGEAPSVVYSGERDGATAVTHVEDTRFAMTVAGAKLKSGRNLGVEKWSFDKDGLLSALNAPSYVNVKAQDIGAVGDDATDDTAAIQAAITAAGAGGTLYFPPGTYKITDNLTGLANLQMLGANRLASIIHQVTASTPGLSMVSGMTIRHMTWRGKGTAGVGEHGLDGGSTNDLLIEDCIFENWGTLSVNLAESSSRCVVRGNIMRNGFHSGVFLAQNTVDCIVTENIIYSCKKNGIDCNGSRNLITKNDIWNIGDAGDFVDTDGIVIFGANNHAECNDNIVTDNIVRSCISRGIVISASSPTGVCRRTKVANNTILSCGRRGILIEGSGASAVCDYHSVIGNTIQGCTNQGILLDGTDNAVVIGNIVDGQVGANANGIHLTTTFKSSTGCVVRGNTVRNNAGTGIIVDSSTVTDYVVKDNVSLGNTTANFTIISTASVRPTAWPNVISTTDVQTLTAVGDAIVVSGEYIKINATGGLTLTSAPTIANGFDRQLITIMNVDTADAVVLQDQGSLANSNLRLGAASRSLGPRDSIILRFDSDIGDWVEVGFNNVI